MSSPTLADVAHALGATLIGNAQQAITGVAPLNVQNNSPSTAMWCAKGNERLLAEIKSGVIICHHDAKPWINDVCSYLLVENPRLAFAKLLNEFFAEPRATGISSSAIIGSDVQIGLNPFIGHNVVIEAGVRIGEGCSIDHNTVVRKNTVIGNNVSIGSNTSIGGSGYAFEKNNQGFYEPIYHAGGVVIEDDVEIGDNVVIDRAMLGNTIIGKNSKVDNLVYVAHGVKIGSNCLVIGTAMLAGSAEIGDNVWVAPNATVMNKITIGTNSTVGLGAVVLKSVPPGSTVAGNPARPLR